MKSLFRGNLTPRRVLVALVLVVRFAIAMAERGQNSVRRDRRPCQDALVGDSSGRTGGSCQVGVVSRGLWPLSLPPVFSMRRYA